MYLFQAQQQQPGSGPAGAGIGGLKSLHHLHNGPNNNNNNNATAQTNNSCNVPSQSSSSPNLVNNSQKPRGVPSPLVVAEKSSPGSCATYHHQRSVSPNPTTSSQGDFAACFFQLWFLEIPDLNFFSEFNFSPPNDTQYTSLKEFSPKINLKCHYLR